MREVSIIGQVRQGNRSYLTGVYECPVCGKHIQKIAKAGRSANACSHKCYAKVRNRRGAYKSGAVIISGYVYEYKPAHPNCTKKGYVAQHRLVAEQNIGRFLTSDEVAHHIDENKRNNNPSNIQVMTASEHSTHHQNFRKCKGK